MINNNRPVASGLWDENSRWEVYISEDLPPTELITAVACVALADVNESIVLTRNKRGWEVLAGHIESGESPEEALRREALEEGGYVVSTAKPFGYRKITATQRPEEGSRESAYPFPVSYIAYYLAFTDSPIGNATGEEILESRTFTKNQLGQLADAGDLDRIEQTIINLGFKVLENNK